MSPSRSADACAASGRAVAQPVNPCSSRSAPSESSAATSDVDADHVVLLVGHVAVGGRCVDRLQRLHRVEAEAEQEEGRRRAERAVVDLLGALRGLELVDLRRLRTVQIHERLHQLALGRGRVGERVVDRLRAAAVGQRGDERRPEHVWRALRGGQHGGHVGRGLLVVAGLGVGLAVVLVLLFRRQLFGDVALGHPFSVPLDQAEHRRVLLVGRVRPGSRRGRTPGPAARGSARGPA